MPPSPSTATSPTKASTSSPGGRKESLRASGVDALGSGREVVHTGKKKRARKGRSPRQYREPPAVREHKSRVARLITDAFAAGEDDDPLGAEIVGSEVALFLSMGPVDDEPAPDLIQIAADRGGRGGLGLLFMVERFGETEDAARAQEHIDDLLAAGVSKPAWADVLGRPEAISAYEAVDDDYGDQFVEVVISRYPGSEPHALCVMIDRNFGYAARDAFLVADHLDQLRADYETELEVRDVSLRHAGGWIAQSAAVTAVLGLSMPVADGYDATVALLDVRSRSLSEGWTPGFPLLTEKERDAVFNEIEGSPEGEGLSDDELSLVLTLVDIKNEVDGDPLRWSPLAVEVMLLWHLPHEMLDSPPEAITRAMEALVRYAGRVQGVPADLFGPTLEAVKEFGEQYTDAVRDASGGVVVALAKAMLADGIDIDDGVAVSDWIAHFNSLPTDERTEIFLRYAED